MVKMAVQCQTRGALSVEPQRRNIQKRRGWRQKGTGEVVETVNMSNDAALRNFDTGAGAIMMNAKWSKGKCKGTDTL
eukprot:4847084-Amphidinium_carterae.1